MMPLMGLWKRKIPFALVLVTALLALLPVLAYLQYRWLGQVSQAERERMQTNLRHAVQQFRQEFDRELARTYLQFQSDKPILQNDLPAYYSRLLADWRAKSPNARLIKDLCWADASKPELELKHFDVESRSAVPIDWPAELTAWREQVKNRVSGPQQSMHALQFFLGDIAKQSSSRKNPEIVASGATDKRSDERTPPIVRLLGKPSDSILGSSPRIIEEALALAIPIAGTQVTPGTPEPKGVARSGYIIVRLDRDYLRNEMLPSLVRRYFQTDKGLDYQVAVLSRSDKRKVIFQSSPNVSADIATSSDASAGLFSLRAEDLGSLIEERLVGSNTLLKDHLALSDRVTMRVVSSNVEKLSPEATRVVSDLDGYWQVFLKHKSGSLEAAVGSVRRRSIAISLGVLTLLGASIVLLLVSTRRAQRLAEQQMDFVAGVSHELRTPLAVIRSAADNLADGYIESPDHIRRYGALIRDEGRRLTDMVEQVLEVAGVQSGRRSYQLRPLDPGRILDQAIAASSLMITEGDFEVDLQLEPDLPLINADAGALVRAIQNLISNAIKYRGENRRLNIRASLAKREGREEICIRIEDFGIGISASDLPHIFEPFFRAREVVGAQIHGSGLGLSLVKHIIESHGGRIVAESAPGKGTAFSLYLPVVDGTVVETDVVEGYGQTNPAH